MVWGSSTGTFAMTKAQVSCARLGRCVGPAGPDLELSCHVPIAVGQYNRDPKARVGNSNITMKRSLSFGMKDAELSMAGGQKPKVHIRVAPAR